MRIPALITVRSASSRLPDKCFLPFGTGSVIEHVVKRAAKGGLDPILCTTVESSDDRIAAIAEARGVKLFRGVVANKLRRWRDCCRAFDLEAFHTVDADDPFFDPEEMADSFALLRNGGWDMVCPSESSASGGGTVGYSLRADAVEKAVAIAGEGEDVDTEMMWWHVDKVPDLRKTTLADRRAGFPSVRLTLDYIEDYWLLASVLRMVSPGAPRADIDALFARNPDLHAVNWFRNGQWAATQATKRV